MKKIICLLFFSGFIISCSKYPNCVTCTNNVAMGPISPTIEICRNNYNTRKEYNNIVDEYNDDIYWDCQ